MYITEIFLQGFRNLSQLHIEPSEGINVIYGSNAVPPKSAETQPHRQSTGKL